MVPWLASCLRAPALGLNLGYNSGSAIYQLWLRTKALGWVPASMACCVALGKLFNLLEPQLWLNLSVVLTVKELEMTIKPAPQMRLKQGGVCKEFSGAYVVSVQLMGLMVIMVIVNANPLEGTSGIHGCLFPSPLVSSLYPLVGGAAYPPGWGHQA